MQQKENSLLKAFMYFTFAGLFLTMIGFVIYNHKVMALNYGVLNTALVVCMFFFGFLFFFGLIVKIIRMGNRIDSLYKRLKSNLPKKEAEEIKKELRQMGEEVW